MKKLLAASILLLSRFAMANVVGTDVQGFNPITSGLSFVTVQSSETLRPGYLNFGLFANYATNSLPRYGGQDPNYSDRLLGLDFNVGLGLLPRWEVGLSLPSVVSQSVSNPSGFSGSYSQNGLTEIRFSSKYRLLGDHESGVALVGSVSRNLIQNNPYIGTGGGPAVSAEIAADHVFGPITAGLNLGHRWRNAGPPLSGLPIQPFRNQWIASTAANYLVQSWDTRIILELFGAVPVTSQGGSSDRQQSSLEALLGAKHDLSEHVAAHLGIGRGIIASTASPDFRIYVGVNVSLGPLFGREREGRPESTSTPGDAPQSETIVARNIYFDFNSAVLKPETREALAPLVEQLRSSPFRRLLIEGHTDSIGSAAYNQRLSEARAKAIRDELVSAYGFARSKIDAQGLGASRPVADNGNFQGRALNRRVEFHIER